MPRPRAPPTVAEVLRKVRLDVDTGIPVKAEMNDTVDDRGYVVTAVVNSMNSSAIRFAEPFPS
jgi:hypothetical protein